MKKREKPQCKGKYLTIEIVFYEDISPENRIPKYKVKHPFIEPKKQLTNKQLLIYNDVIDSIIGIISSYGLHLEACYQLKRSYTFYVPFYKDKNSRITFIFKALHGHFSDKGSDNSGYFINHVAIDPIIYDSVTIAITDLSTLCGLISKGKYKEACGKYTFRDTDKEDK